MTAARTLQPMLATLVDAPFDDDAWSFELKWDGVRALAYVDGARLTLVSRNGNPLLAQFPELGSIGKAFRARRLILDGEIVTFDPRGRSSFQRLAPRLNRTTSSPALEREAPAVYIVFDILLLDGHDLRDEPLDDRVAALERSMRPDSERYHVRSSKRTIGKGRALFAKAQARGLEGIIAKRRDSVYESSRSRNWLKIKCLLEQEMVIGGWTQPRGSREAFGALLVGYYRGGNLVYAGRVGTGFDGATLAAVMKRLRPLETKRSAFAQPPKEPATTHWVRPRLVAQVKFSEWTTAGILRQPVFLGLRFDKEPASVVRESARPQPKRQTRSGRRSPIRKPRG
jgi:bifunctional non-homologous end joining protein LigD